MFNSSVIAHGSPQIVAQAFSLPRRSSLMVARRNLPWDPRPFKASGRIHADGEATDDAHRLKA